ncbi:UNVERIFIED_CONTAM: hypothetical protein NCL1_60616, partial [Trichonephila clavipes]
GSQGQGNDGRFEVSQLYRLQGEGHGCEDLNFKRLTLRASGTEPFWQLEVGSKGLVLNRPEHEPLALPYLEEQLPEGRLNFSSEANGQRLELWVAPQRCVDGMSGAVNHLSAELRLDGQLKAASQEGDHHATSSPQRIWAHRPRTHARSGAARSAATHPPGRDQRPRRLPDPHPPDALRLHLRPLSRRGGTAWRAAAPRWPIDPPAQRARGVQPALEPPGRGPGAGMLGQVQEARTSRAAPDRRRAARAALAPAGKRGPDRGLWRQPPVAEQPAADRLQRILHHQLPGAAGQGAARGGGHPPGAGQHGACLHQRPEPAGQGPQRPLSRPRRRAVDDPHQHRCRPDHRPGAAGAVRAPRRPLGARADPQRVAARPDLQRRAYDQPRGDQCRAAERCQGHDARRHGVQRGAAGFHRLQRLPGLLRGRSQPHPRAGRPGQGAGLVRQRMGIRQPHARRPAVLASPEPRQPALNVAAALAPLRPWRCRATTGTRRSCTIAALVTPCRITTGPAGYLP